MRLFIILTLLLPGLALSSPQTWVNTAGPAQLVELYTSEGCSSCPRADRRLSTMRNRADLWHKLIPMAFHVDYWNYLGWKDRFSQREYSQRQRWYHSKGAVKSVYTPGWVVGGKEWRGFFSSASLPEYNPTPTSPLSIQLEARHLIVDYPKNQPLQAHMVVLGFDLTTHIQAGENQGKELQHDFVVLEYQQRVSGNGKWGFRLHQGYPGNTAIAVWLTQPDGTQIIQTVAGWL